jgi:geranylgeranyl diphosphate synthase, type I
MPASPLQELQARFSARLEGRILQWVALCEREPGFAGMMRYQMGYVDERLHPVAVGRGKLFRPLLCLLACESTGGKVDDALDTAAAVELLHNFSLVHDDIEDHDETRRHRPTVWKVWGEPQGINVGDGMFALAYHAVLALGDPETAITVARRFGDTALLLTEGQYLDMSFETRHDVSDAEYLDMIGKKSAALVEFATWAGSRIAGATEHRQEAMRRFGRALGSAFQMYDDIMGIWGRAEDTGKRTGTDLENRKKTLPLLLAARQATGSDAEIIRAYLSGEEVDVDLLRDCLDRLRIGSQVQEAVRRHLADAVEALHAAQLEGAHEDQLVAISDELTGQRSATNWEMVSKR